MMRITAVVLTLFLSMSCFAQFDPSLLDSTVDNLRHPVMTQTCAAGTAGRITKTGRGEPAMIVITGWGFDERAYGDFVKEYSGSHTVYVITPAGFGETPPPPFPDTSVKYSDRPWTDRIVTSILRLIHDKQLRKSIVIGHFVTGGNAAIDLAIHHSESIGGVVLISAAPYRYVRPRADTVWGREQVLSPEQRNRIAGIMATMWFKRVPRSTWNDGNHRPEEYALDSANGLSYSTCRPGSRSRS